jgi:hypothetical protein
VDILITGGTGSIGRVLCRSLAEKGHRLTVLSRKPGSVPAICGDGVAALASLADLPASARFDAVVNLAGEPVIGPYWTERRKQRLRDSRVALTSQLVDFIARAEHKPQALISASAVGYYGDGGERLIDEQTPGAGGFAHRLCADWEQAAARAGQHGVRVCAVRFGLVLMPHGGMLKAMLPSFRLGLGARLGDGRQWMPWIHCRDLVAMLEWLLDSPTLEGVFNGVSPNPVRNHEFTAALARHLRRPAFLFVPAFVLRLAMGEMGGLLLEGQQAVPKRALEAGFAFRYATLDAALADITSQI